MMCWVVAGLHPYHGPRACNILYIMLTDEETEDQGLAQGHSAGK
jgi:hypothetical protein